MAKSNNNKDFFSGPLKAPKPKAHIAKWRQVQLLVGAGAALSASQLAKPVTQPAPVAAGG